jgi:A/G-specific adenine glycosylase
VNGKYVLQKRTGRDIWNGLYEFPLVETRRPVSWSVLRKDRNWPSWIDAAPVTKPVTHRQVLSHQVIHGRFFELTMDKFVSGTHAHSLQKLRRVALPRIITWYLESRSLL